MIRYRPAAMRGWDFEYKLSVALGLAFGAIFTILGVWQLDALVSFEPQDAAVETQLLYHVATHGFFKQTIFYGGTPDHFWPIAYLLAPLFKICPGVETWRAMSSFAYGLCAPAFYLIARDRGLAKSAALTVATLFLLFAPLHFVALGAVDGARVFALPAFTAALFFLGRRQLRAFLIALLLACMCKEDMALIGVGFAVYQWSKGFSKEWILGTLTLSLTYLVVAVIVVNTVYAPWPIEGKALSGFYYFDQHSVQNLVGMGKFKASELQRYLGHPTKWLALFALVWPLLFVPLFTGIAWVPASMMVVLVLARPRFYNQNSDYLAPLIPFIFVGFIYALARLKNPKRWLAVASVLVLAQHLGTTVFGDNRPGAALSRGARDASYAERFAGLKNIFDRRLYRANEVDSGVHEILERIPENASVTASGSLLPLLSGRDELYEFGGWDRLPPKEHRPTERRNYAADIVVIDRECRVADFTGAYACPSDAEIEREIAKILKTYRYHRVADDGTFALFSTPRGPVGGAIPRR